MVEAEEPMDTFVEVAVQFKVTVETVRRWHAQGLLRAVRPVPAGNFRVPRSEVERLMQGEPMEPVDV